MARGPGLTEDGLTKALSKFASKQTKSVTNNLKQLTDLTFESGDSEAVIFDKIEEKVLEMSTENLKGDELDKKKKEVLTELCKVTGKTPPKTEDEEKEEKEKERK